MAIKDDIAKMYDSLYKSKLGALENSRNEALKKVNEEKNELLAKLGCPTIATARMKVLCLQDQFKLAEQKLEKIKDYCKEQNLKADWTACEILKIIEE